MIIRQYFKEYDEEKLMKLIENEGEEWSCYSAEEVAEKYRTALANSITYVAYDGDTLCGYSRSLNDCGFYIYVCDLLVMPEHRGKHIGRKLMECIYGDYPDQIVFVMSDVDEYYMKQGYRREGSIFEVKDREE
jgi:ribosomal protein S18 acetylase RimI-like enzyme